MPDTLDLLERIRTLPEERQVEVEDFVEFLIARQERALARAMSAASEASFSAVWDNPDDAVYDAI